jgi:predicted NBD/HSP70 family sugar kinase
MPLSGEFGHTPVAGNERRCGCGAVGCLETLISERGLLASFSAARSQAAEGGIPKSKVQGAEPDDGQPAGAASWSALVARVTERGVEPWLAEALDATAKVIAGALNVLGLQRVVVAGLLAELPGCVLEHLTGQIKQGAIWARFGEVVCQSAPHRRAAGLVGVGLDRLVLPSNEEKGLIVQNSK